MTIQEFTKGDKFEDLGSLKEFCINFGTCNITIQDKSDRNISLTIKSMQEVEIKVLCSFALSEIIRQVKGFPKEFQNYRVLRITKANGERFIRVSQSISLEADPKLSIEDNINLYKNILGSKNIVFNVDDLDAEPYKPTKLDDLISF